MPTELAKYVEGVGKRKAAVARVRLTPAPRATFEINSRPSDKYFPAAELQNIIRKPLPPTKKFKISVKVSGGGTHAQAEAVSLGLARALIKFDSGLRSGLKKNRLLSRDARIKERRKFGLKKARKAPQWSKR